MEPLLQREVPQRFTPWQFSFSHLGAADIEGLGPRPRESRTISNHCFEHKAIAPKRNAWKIHFVWDQVGSICSFTAVSYSVGPYWFNCCFPSAHRAQYFSLYCKEFMPWNESDKLVQTFMYELALWGVQSAIALSKLALYIVWQLFMNNVHVGRLLTWLFQIFFF